jgi:hypothetical protein
MAPSLLARLGRYIATKQNFLRASVFGFGLPFGVFEAFLVQPYGPAAVVVAVLVAPVAGYVWGLAMWHLMFKRIYAKRAAATSSKGS